MVKVDNPFDRKLELLGQNSPAGVNDAAIYVSDTLEVATAMAVTHFGESPAWELVVALYDRINAERHRSCPQD